MRCSIILILTVVLFYSGTAHAEKFTDNGNGTVTDNVTALIWQQEDDDTARKWEQAIIYCESLSLGGNADWRLPNIKALRSIVGDTVRIPAINTTYFPNTNLSFYWSSTTFASNNSAAWYVGFNNGDVFSSDNRNGHYVRCVRGGS